jgi:hypothetical protein
VRAPQRAHEPVAKGSASASPITFATPASARLRRARASWCGLWSSIVTRSGATLRTIASVANPVPAPTSTTSRPGSSRRASASAASRIGAVQNSGLIQRS